MTRLYQLYPKWEKPSNYRAKGWTGTVQGYLNEARDLTTCILQNQRLMGVPYSWFVSVNIERELDPETHRTLWKTVSGALRRGGVIALWVREPSESNHVNYHLLIKNSVPKEQVTRILKDSIKVPWHHSIAPVWTHAPYAHYLTKAKIGGFIKLKAKGTGAVESRWVEDKYARKRRLFRANTKLKKHGVIGNFWEKPRAAMLEGIIDTNVRIARGLRQDGVRDLVDYAVEHLGISKSIARRHFGYWADNPSIRHWIDQLQATGEISSPLCPAQPSTPNINSERTVHEHDKRL